MIYNFELNDEDKNFAEAYASEVGIKVGELAKKTLLEHIEDIMELRLYEQSKAEYEADPVTYTLDEVEAEIIGNAADLVVLEQDPFLVKPEEISLIKISSLFTAGIEQLGVRS